MVEGDRLLPLLDQVFVHHVEHLEEGVVLGDPFGDVGLEPAGLVRPLLPPDDQFHAHRLVFGSLRAHYLWLLTARWMFSNFSGSLWTSGSLSIPLNSQAAA